MILETFLSRKLLSYVVVVLQASPVNGQYLLRAAHIGYIIKTIGHMAPLPSTFKSTLDIFKALKLNRPRPK